MPHQILARIASAAVPKLSEKLQRSMSVPARTMSMGSQRDEDTTTAANTGIDMNTRTRSVPYISFEAIIGRNSRFYDLQEEELEELGGVEYRALRMLLWLVPVVRALLSSMSSSHLWRITLTRLIEHSTISAHN